MPYISQARRERIMEELGRGIHDPRDSCPQNGGELNWLITAFINHYLNTHGTSYTVMNEILGALSGAGQEFYRRVVAPYEETQRKLSGDVYGPVVDEIARLGVQ